MASKKRTFYVQVKVEAFVDVPVQATSLGDALEQFEGVKEAVVDYRVPGSSLNTEDLTVTGVYAG